MPAYCVVLKRIDTMSSVPQAVSREAALPAVRWKGFVRQWFYFVMTLLSAGILVWGFGHTVNPVLLHPAVPRPRILWVHAIVFSLWLVFALGQTALVRVRRVAIHRVMGWFGVGLAALMVGVGIKTALALGRF